MNVTLDQAIEIHARALKHRFGGRAALLAEERAHDCAADGDEEGRVVWLQVAAVARRLPNVRSQHSSIDETL